MHPTKVVDAQYKTVRISYFFEILWMTEVLHQLIGNLVKPMIYVIFFLNNKSQES